MKEKFSKKIANLCFDLDDENKWKIMSIKNSEFNNIYGSDINCGENLDINNEALLEKYTREELMKQRADISLETHFSLSFGHLLGIAAQNYECQQLNYESNHTKELEECFKAIHKADFDLKIIPLHLKRFSKKLLLKELESLKTYKHLYTQKNHSIELGVYCKIFKYIEEIYSIWIIIGIKY